MKVQRECVAVVGCCVLHNIGVNRGDIISNADDQAFSAKDMMDDVVGMVNNAKTVREHIARITFVSHGLNYFVSSNPSYSLYFFKNLIKTAV